MFWRELANFLSDMDVFVLLPTLCVRLCPLSFHGRASAPHVSVCSCLLNISHHQPSQRLDDDFVQISPSVESVSSSIETTYESADLCRRLRVNSPAPVGSAGSPTKDPDSCLLFFWPVGGSLSMGRAFHHRRAFYRYCMPCVRYVSAGYGKTQSDCHRPRNLTHASDQCSKPLQTVGGYAGNT